MDCSKPGLPVHHQLLEFTQIHVPWVSDAIQPSHPLSSRFPAFKVWNSRMTELQILQQNTPRDGWLNLRAYVCLILHHVSHAVLYYECISYCCFPVAKLCLTLWNPMDCSTPGFPELHPLAEFAPTHVHWLIDGMQISHPRSPPSLPALNLSQHY